MEPGDEIVACPFDDSHRILARSLQAHIIKCQKNHPGKKLVQCRFNRTHKHTQAEIGFHEKNCPSRNILDREMQMVIEKKHGIQGLKGDVIGPEIKPSHREYNSDDEDWEYSYRSATNTPRALFSRQEEEKRDAHKNPRRAQFQDPEYLSRKPTTVPKAAQVAMPKEEPVPNKTEASQVFDFSYMQTKDGRARIGRGRSALPLGHGSTYTFNDFTNEDSVRPGRLFSEDLKERLSSENRPDPEEESMTADGESLASDVDLKGETKEELFQKLQALVKKFQKITGNKTDEMIEAIKNIPGLEETETGQQLAENTSPPSPPAAWRTSGTPACRGKGRGISSQSRQNPGASSESQSSGSPYRSLHSPGLPNQSRVNSMTASKLGNSPEVPSESHYSHFDHNQSRHSPVRPSESLLSPVRPSESRLSPVRASESRLSPVRPSESRLSPVRPSELWHSPVARDVMSSPPTQSPLFSPQSPSSPAGESKRSVARGRGISSLVMNQSQPGRPAASRSERNIVKPRGRGSPAPVKSLADIGSGI